MMFCSEFIRSCILLAQAEEQGAATGGLSFKQSSVFWAYGMACLLLLVFTLWTAVQARTLSRKLDSLEGRFRKAHPED